MFKTDKKLLPLPKLVIVVPDDDVISAFKEGDTGHRLSKNYSRLTNYIMTEHERCIASYKEYLSAKSVKPYYPHILWIEAPMHDNFANNSQCYKFNKALQETAKLHHNVSTLMLKKVWDSKNMNLYLKDCQRFTSDGYYAYWEAVDRTVRYCDSVMLKKLAEKRIPKKKSLSQKGCFDQKDQKNRFRWKNPLLNVDVSPPMSFKRLPSPP